MPEAEARLHTRIIRCDDAVGLLDEGLTAFAWYSLVCIAFEESDAQLFPKPQDYATECGLS